MGRAWEQHQAEDDEGLWLVSYADMVSLLLCFFIILFSFSKIDQGKFEHLSDQLSESMRGEEKKQTGESNYGIRNEQRRVNALQTLVSMLDLGDNLDRAVEAIEARSASVVKAAAAEKELITDLRSQSQLEVVKRAKSAVIEIVLPERMIFAPGADQLAESARDQIREIANIITKQRDLIQVEIVGHTDSLPPGKQSRFADNWGLSAARAGKVAQELLKSGMDARLVRASGMANIDPLFPELDASGRAIASNRSKNRRVHIIIRKRTHAD